MEHILPKEYQFNTSLAEVREIIVDAIYDAKADVGDVINPSAEFSHPYNELWTFSDGLAKLFAAETEDIKSVQATIYRAVCFGLQVVDDIKVAPISKLSMAYITSIPDTNDLAESIRTDVEEYLSTHPGIKSLIEVFTPDIAAPETNESYAYIHHVETAAGLMFMLCEREQAEVYVRVNQEALGAQLTEE